MKLGRWLELGSRRKWELLDYVCAILGGNWDNGTIYGLLSRNLNNERTNSNNNVGGGL
jgi:hypothetical protein